MFHTKKCKLSIYLAIFFIVLSAGSFLFMNKVNSIAEKDSNNIPLIICGGVFWVGTLGCYLCLIVTASIRRKLIQLGYEDNSNVTRVGIFNICSNKEAIVADICLGISVLATLIVVQKNINGLMGMSVLGMLFLCVHLHAILNGKLYGYVKGIR